MIKLNKEAKLRLSCICGQDLYIYAYFIKPVMSLGFFPLVKQHKSKAQIRLKPQ